jgi:hypothetical protein
MGIAKSIEAYTIYQDYTENTEKFIRKLSDNLNADFIVNTYDKDYEPLHKEDKLTAYSKPNRYRLTICYYDNYMPVYELRLPINYEYDDSIELVFNPNNSVHIMFLTFEHLWESFIVSLKFESIYEDRQESIERYERLRNEYRSLLQKIGIGSIFIVTHAYYHIENLEDEKTYPILTFSDIRKIAKEMDNLTSFDLEKILRTDKVSEICKDFLVTPSLNIAFIDNFNPKY